MMSVRRKASGSAMERSTWVSAAKLTMASTPFGRPHDRVAVTDVAVDEAVARVVLDRAQVVGVAGVGELVQVDDLARSALDSAGESAPDEVGADEAGSAAHQELHPFVTAQS